MANQLSIARELGVTQATVSMALRNHPRVSEDVRRRVREAAEKSGYRPNPSVVSLMSHIRNGRAVKEHGCIGILVDAASEEKWLELARETYSDHLGGHRKEATRHGYRAECFFLRAPGVSPEIIDRRLRARGIRGLILAMPRLANVYPGINVCWDNYACAAVGSEWLEIAVDRVLPHFSQNMRLAFSALLQRGCRRIGFCQPTPAMPRKVPSDWMAGFLEWQWEYNELPGLKPFVGTIHETTEADFRAWFRRWKPDGLITIIGDEAPRLRAMGVRLRGVDADACDRRALQVVCVNRPHNSPFPGVDANNELIGRKACETVVNQLIHNRHGLPEHPNEILVPGRWME